MTAAESPVATAERQRWMGILARAKPARLAAMMPRATPRYEVVRLPETGTVMVEGRTGATGTPFNLGEMSVTRCSLRLESGLVGHGYVQGRDKAHATRAALIDALLQSDGAPAILAGVIDPLAREETAKKAARAAKAAATKVEFFTLVRGEDQ